MLGGLQFTRKGLFTPHERVCENEKDQRTSKKDQRISDKHQRNISFSFGVNGP